MAKRVKINKKHVLCVKYAVCVVIEKDNKLLLLRRFNTGWKDGYYAFPAGHVEDDETFKQAAVKELGEESNLRAKENYLDLIHVVDVSSTSSQFRYFYLFFKCNKWFGEVKNNEPNKCDNLQWFDKKHLPRKFSPISFLAWKNIQKGSLYSEYGWKKNKELRKS